MQFYNYNIFSNTLPLRFVDRIDVVWEVYKEDSLNLSPEVDRVVV